MREEFSPIRAFFAACGFGPKAQPLTPEQMAKQQLYQAEIELLEAEQVKEVAFANVEKLKARVRRLKSTNI